MTTPYVPSLFDTLTPDAKSDRPMISEGDCGVIMKLDGSFQVFSTGVSNLSSDPSSWGDTEIAQMTIGRKLMAISVALSNTQIMELLMDITAGVLDPEKVVNAVRKH